MKNNFLLLTTIDKRPIIVGISNIASIEELEKGATNLTMNFARNGDMWPQVILVSESFEEIKSMIGF